MNMKKEEEKTKMHKKVNKSMKRIINHYETMKIYVFKFILLLN